MGNTFLKGGFNMSLFNSFFNKILHSNNAQNNYNFVLPKSNDIQNQANT